MPGAVPRKSIRSSFELVCSKTVRLLRHALLRRDPVCLDLALDLLVLPVSYVALNVAVLIMLAALAVIWVPALQPWLWVGWGCAAAMTLYILRGWQLSGTGVLGLLDLARAPFFLLWKIMAMLTRRNSREWVRTTREGS